MLWHCWHYNVFSGTLNPTHFTSLHCWLGERNAIHALKNLCQLSQEFSFGCGTSGGCKSRLNEGKSRFTWKTGCENGMCVSHEQDVNSSNTMTARMVDSSRSALQL